MPTVPQPKAVKKHDGRVVAFECSRLADSAALAALASGESQTYDAARIWTDPIAAEVAARVFKEFSATPASADLRATLNKVLRETGHIPTADAFVEHARSTASFLWRLRIHEGAMRSGGMVPARKTGIAVPDRPVSGGVDFESSAWDRRRLMDSLRQSGLARDPAGETARSVERKLILLEEEWVSAALVHALAVEEISRRGSDPRNYVMRRVPVVFSRETGVTKQAVLEQGASRALEAFWRETAHSSEVAAAVRNSLLSLQPVPLNSNDIVAPAGWLEAFDPCTENAQEHWRLWCQTGKTHGPLTHPEIAWVRTDSLERSIALSRLLAEQVENGSLARKEVRLWLRPPGERIYARPKRCAPPLVLNLAGLMVRSGLRDPLKATRKVAHLAALAAQAHREREEFWGLSPVRGRELPILASGFWNAAAWLVGESFERPPFMPSVRMEAATLSSVIYGAIATLRAETGLNLSFWSAGLPLYWKRGEAAEECVADGWGLKELWRSDGMYFARDGARLDDHGAYGLGLELTPFGLPLPLMSQTAPVELETHGSPVSSERVLETLEYLVAVSPNFDEPPPLVLETPLGVEADPQAWRELFSALSESRLNQARLLPNGGKRGLKVMSRMIRNQAEGLPLFENELNH